jgi:hypothetical protein
MWTTVLFLVGDFAKFGDFSGNYIGDKGKIAWHFSPNSVAK